MNSPLANRIRPDNIDQVFGQRQLLSENMPLRRIIENGVLPNMIFYGPSGTGKTTLAEILAKKTNRTLRKLNGTSAGTGDIKDIVSELDTMAAPNGILLYLDEIQYFNKKQQQSLLQYIECGDITLIASTTENPYFYVYSALLSRCTVFEFKSLTSSEIVSAIKRGFEVLEKENGVEIISDEKVVNIIAESSGGDVRKALNFTELSFYAEKSEDGKVKICEETVRELTRNNSFRFDKKGDENYDVMSALQKSLRGSDPDAAVHYLARLLEGGDLPSACRRILVCACEDVGLSYPQIIPIVKACVDSALMVGLPEARIPLADAVILIATAPKSNSAYIAINEAMADIESGKYGRIPRNLQNKHFDGEDNNNKGQFYLYPHDFKNHFVHQQYLPDELKNKKYYLFGDNKAELAAKAYWDKIKNDEDKKR